MYKFVGKSLFVETGGKRILALSDLHLGYDESLQRSGIFIPNALFSGMYAELEQILSSVGKIDEVVILGDLKHVFGTVLRGEREEVFKILDLAQRFCTEVIIIKGNHDAIIEPLAAVQGVRVVDYYLCESYAFLHGDRDFEALYDASVSTWVVGHAHPAITLYDASKSEKYKCFLVGKYRRKTIIVVPSFFSATEGSDVCTQDLGLVWPVDIGSCEAHIVGEDLNVLSFGSVQALCSST